MIFAKRIFCFLSIFLMSFGSQASDVISRQFAQIESPQAFAEVHFNAILLKANTTYTALCSAPGQLDLVATGATPPLIVSGLASGVQYACAVSESAPDGRQVEHPVEGKSAPKLYQTNNRPAIIPIISMLLLDSDTNSEVPITQKNASVFVVISTAAISASL